MAKQEFTLDNKFSHREGDKNWIVIEIKGTTLDFQNPEHRKIMEAALGAIGPVLFKEAQGIKGEVTFEDADTKILSMVKNNVEDMGDRKHEH